MRIVHYYRDCAKRSGVTHAIDQWQRATAEAGVETVLLHNALPVTRELPHRAVRHLGRGRHTQIPVLAGQVRRGDVLVLHEGWVTSNQVAAVTARTAGAAYVVVPHGVYQPQILEDLKSPRLPRFGAEQTYLSHAGAIHTFYAPEHTLAESVAGRTLPRLVAPTGFDVPEARWVGGGGYLAWHGRYSPHHKGLDRLLRAYALTDAAQVPPLRLHGPTYHDGQERVDALVAELGLGPRVSVGAPINGQEKTEFLCRSEGYVFPSRWESHPMSLLEALSFGAPVLLQNDLHASGWVLEAGAATGVDFDDAPAAAAHLAVLPTRDTGAVARRFVRDRLDWATILPPYLAALQALAEVP